MISPEDKTTDLQMDKLEIEPKKDWLFCYVETNICDTNSKYSNRRSMIQNYMTRNEAIKSFNNCVRHDKNYDVYIKGFEVVE